MKLAELVKELMAEREILRDATLGGRCPRSVQVRLAEVERRLVAASDRLHGTTRELGGYR